MNWGLSPRRGDLDESKAGRAANDCMRANAAEVQASRYY